MKIISHRLILALTVMSALAAGLFTGCAGPGEVKAFYDAGQPVSVTAGQEFVIALESNITTGFSWQASFDEDSLVLVEKTYKEKDNSGKVGGGGADYFRFKALKSGETKVTLSYRRPWETPSAQDKTAVFNVSVK
jgi:inhibitor of cysteine peptidase